MKIITFTYKLIPQKQGFCVECLDWRGIISQGETITECKKNMIECTELFFDCYNDYELSKNQYPVIKKHFASPYTFQLSFDCDTGKYVSEKKLQLFQKIVTVRKLKRKTTSKEPRTCGMSHKPNKETLKAIKEARGCKSVRYKNVKNLIVELSK